MISIPRHSEVILPNGPISVGPVRNMTISGLDRGLAERRIYLYLETLQSAQADFVLFAQVRGLDNGTIVAQFPAQLSDFRAGNITLPQSMGSSFASGGSPVGDCFILELAQPFNASITSVVLQPLRVNLQITDLEFDIIGYAGQLQGYRAWMGCLSTAY